MLALLLCIVLFCLVCLCQIVTWIHNINIGFSPYALLCIDINQYQYIFNVLETYWGPKTRVLDLFSELYRQPIFPTCKTLPKKTTTCIGLTKRPEDCYNAEKAHMLGSDMTVRWTIKDKVRMLLVLHTSKRLANQATPTHVNIFCAPVCVYLKTMTTCSESAD